MTTAIIASYNDAISVSFRSDAWFNATQVAASFGKTPKDWLRTEETKAYINAIGQICLIDEKQLVSKKAGHPDNGGGTWMHPKLGIPFARWLDAKFGVWCDLQIEKILHGRSPIALKDLRSKKALPGGLTLEQQDCVKDLVKSRVEALPAEKRGGAAVTLWSALKSHFGCTYKAISPELLTDALSLVARVDLEGETRPTLPLVLTQDSTNLAGQRLLVCIADDGSSYHARSVSPDAYIMNGTQFLTALSAGDIYLQRVETHLLMDGVDYLNRTIRYRIADMQRGVVTAPA